jgi:ketosteroid isomerase-like protein
MVAGEASMDANVELVRGFLEGARRYREGNWDHLELLAEDVVYVPIEEIAESRECHGRAEFRRFMESFYGEVWDEIEIRPTSYRAIDDKVIVRLELTGRGRVSTAETRARVFSVYSVHAGRIVRIEDYTDRSTALAAAGFSA